MDATLQTRRQSLPRSFPNISTPQELSDVLRLMSKSMIECMLQAEMDVHLSEDGARNAQGTATAAAKDRTAETAGETGATRSAGGKSPVAIAATELRARPCKASRDV